jgi:glycosyltransferase involved in cell wall biosynthesis
MHDVEADVVHLVDAMGSSRLWGKERAIELLMRAQRRAGVAPALLTFAPTPLLDVARDDGFPAEALGTHSRRFAFDALGQVIALLRARPGLVLHTHAYKANVVGRLARLARAPAARFVATVHGMNDETPALARYNGLDRLTSALSDVVAVADATLLDAFPRRARVLYVPNGVEDAPPFDPRARAEARKRFDLPPDAFVVGLLGRINEAKGVRDALAALRALDRPDVIVTFAGEGELVGDVAATSGARWLGYVDVQAYLPALDVYLQASHMEGLSLALLEAMRGGLPSVATRVGSTDRAVSDGVEGLLVPPHQPQELAAAIARLVGDRASCTRMGLAARARFEAEFSIDRQATIYAKLYRERK